MITFFNIIVLDDKKLKQKWALTIIFGQNYRGNVDLWVFDRLEPWEMGGLKRRYTGLTNGAGYGTQPSCQNRGNASEKDLIFRLRFRDPGMFNSLAPLTNGCMKIAQQIIDRKASFWECLKWKIKFGSRGKMTALFYVWRAKSFFYHPFNNFVYRSQVFLRTPHEYIIVVGPGDF